MDPCTIVAIDPGMTKTGLAAFDYRAFQASNHTFQDAMKSLRFTLTLTPRPAKDPMPERLSGLVGHVDEFVTLHLAELVIIEEPAIAGTYARKKSSRKSLNTLFMAIGAVAAHCSAITTTILEPADGTTKEARQQLINRILEDNHDHSEHEFDAIWLGALAISNGTARLHLDHDGPTLVH